MVGKPKAFFIQSCRGEAYQETMVQPDNDEEEEDAEKFRVPTDGDIFIAYSTTEGKHDKFRIYIGYSVNLIYVFQTDRYNYKSQIISYKYKTNPNKIPDTSINRRQVHYENIVM